MASHLRRRRFSIRRQLVSLTMAFSLGIALVVWWSSVYALYTTNRRSTLQNAEYTLQVAANSIAQGVQEIDDLANWCTVDAVLQTYFFNHLSTRTVARTIYQEASNKYSSLNNQRYVQRMLLYNGDFPVLQFGTAASFSVGLNAGNIDKLPGMAEARDCGWEGIVTDPLILNQASRGIPLLRTIKGTGGIKGKIYISVSDAILTDALRSYNLPEGNALYFVMGDRVYLVGEDGLSDQGAADSFTALPYTGVETLDPATRLYTFSAGGSEHWAIAYPLGRHAMYLVQSIPQTAAWWQLPALQTPALLTLCGIVLLGGVLALLLRRVVAKPIQCLQRQLALIADGNFTTDPAIEWNNELGDIGRGINSLSRSVTALMDKRLEDEKQKQDLEYRMLQNQINPHFIYNTLNSIKWMATIQHAPGIAEMVTALSRLLKSVSKSTARLVPLYEEFALLNDYFTIQQYRYGGTISMDVRYIEDERLCRDCMIPRFTLQPLVENAIFHGIEPKGCAGDVSLTVRQDPTNGDVLIDLKDDGVGMTPDQLARALREPGPEEAAAKFRHVGMWNVHKRLQYSFGPGYGLRLASTPGEGTTVTIRLPICPAAAEPRPKHKGGQDDERTAGR